jgi:hypothetical protein
VTTDDELGSGLYFGAQPVVSVFVPGAPEIRPIFEFDDVTPVEVQTYRLEREDPNSFPYPVVTEYDLVFDVLPADLHGYLRESLRAACAAADTVVWLGFEGSFWFSNILTEEIAPQIYGACAPGGEPVVAADLNTLRTAEWRSVISSYRGQLEAADKHHGEIK